MWIQGLAGMESGSKINGSQPSEGAQQATDDQIQQKPSRNYISGPVSPLAISGHSGSSVVGVGTENSQDSLLFTSFTSPLISRAICMSIAMDRGTVYPIVE